MLYLPFITKRNPHIVKSYFKYKLEDILSLEKDPVVEDLEGLQQWHNVSSIVDWRMLLGREDVMPKDRRAVHCLTTVYA